MTDDNTQAKTWKDTLIEVLASIGALLPFLPIGGLLIWLGRQGRADALPEALRADLHGDALREARRRLAEQGDELRQLREDCRRALSAAGQDELLERAQLLKQWRERYQGAAKANEALERDIGERILDASSKADRDFHDLFDKGKLVVTPELRERWERNEALNKARIDDELRAFRELRGWDGDIQAAMRRLLPPEVVARAQDDLLKQQQREILAEKEDVQTLAQLGVGPALQQDAREIAGQQRQLDLIRTEPVPQRPAAMGGLQQDISTTERQIEAQVAAQGAGLGAQQQAELKRQQQRIDAIDGMVEAGDRIEREASGEHPDEAGRKAPTESRERVEA
jgi:hypothetical protein